MSNKPIGAEYDSAAPYNQPMPTPITIEVEAVVILSKRIKITTTEYDEEGRYTGDLREYMMQEGINPQSLFEQLSDFRRVGIKCDKEIIASDDYDEVLKDFYRVRLPYMEKSLDACGGWTEDIECHEV